MKRFMRPYIHLGIVAVLGAWTTMLPPGIAALTTHISQIAVEPSPLLLHSSSQGYLGVLVGDVDNDSATKLKLKDVRGALITLIDHDAPAAQAGLRVNDVVLEVNGQAVEGAEQFGRMMREIPAGRKISLVISRDGNPQTIPVQLVDRKAMEHDVWNKLGNSGDASESPQGMGILGTNGDAPLPGGFHMPFFGSSLNVGAMVEPLTSQMADYLGVSSGLMVKQVVRKSEASAAGFKAFDVILKVGTESIATISDWDRSLRANQGKQVQVTILRDKKQQTINLQVDSKHKSEMDFEEIFPSSECPLMASVDPEFAEQWANSFAVDGSALQALGERNKALLDDFAFRDNFSGENFRFDPKELDQLKQQMEEFQHNFKMKDFDFKNFGIDPRQMEEFNKEMKELNQTLPDQFNLQMDQFKLQMDQKQALHLGNHV